MKKDNKISNAEWEIMKIVWNRPGLTGTDIFNLVAENTKWNYRTVKTLISRLVAKKVLKFGKKGNTYFYHPQISRSELVRQESRSFIDRVFDGATQPMIAHLVKHGNLTKGDIAELKKILDDKGSAE